MRIPKRIKRHESEMVVMNTAVGVASVRTCSLLERSNSTVRPALANAAKKAIAASPQKMRPPIPTQVMKCPRLDTLNLLLRNIQTPVAFDDEFEFVVADQVENPERQRAGIFTQVQKFDGLFFIGPIVNQRKPIPIKLDQ